MMTICQLDWDTAFFGYPVARASVGNDTFDIDVLKHSAQPFRLTYVVSDRPIDHPLLCMGDSKVIFEKQVQHHPAEPTVVKADSFMLEAFKRIGRQSGVWSRFALDPHFQNHEFERLYDVWVQRSIEEVIAFANLTVLDGQQPTSLITVGNTDADTATIGLFAVAEAHRGKGIGSRLLRAAESYSAERGYSRISVATQGKNRNAQRVYEHFGFRPASVTYIYNYWNEAFTVQ